MSVIQRSKVLLYRQEESLNTFAVAFCWFLDRGTSIWHRRPFPCAVGPEAERLQINHRGWIQASRTRMNELMNPADPSAAGKGVQFPSVSRDS